MFIIEVILVPDMKFGAISYSNIDLFTCKKMF